jgi:hypothetical protein
MDSIFFVFPDFLKARKGKGFYPGFNGQFCEFEILFPDEDWGTCDPLILGFGDQ